MLASMGDKSGDGELCDATEKRMAQIMKGMEFDGALATSGTLLNFLTGDEEIGDWKKLRYADEAGGGLHKLMQDQQPSGS